MIDIKDSKIIKIIQGETLTSLFTFGEEYKNISSAIFVCKDLDLNIGLIPDNADTNDDESSDSNSNSDSGESSGQGSDNWYLWYEGDTNEFRPGTFTYDVTITSADGIKTTVYNGQLIVIYKTNPQHYNPYYEYPHNTKREH